MSTAALSDFEKWALSVAVPWMKWPALENPTEIDLLERVHFLAWDWHDGEKELINILCDFGVLDYMMEEQCKNQK